MSEVLMPRLSDTMEEGELSKWLKNEGDEVAKGDILAEIETDKATMDLEAFESGVLEKQLVEAGTVVAIGTPVAMIGDGSGKSAAPAKGAPKKDAAEKDSADKDSADKDTAKKDTAKKDSADKDTAKKDSAKESAPAEGPTPEEAPTEDAPKKEESAEVASTAEVSAEEAPVESDAVESGDIPAKLRMSPLARKIAKDHGLDPSTISGSGPQGRVVRADVEAAIASGPASDSAGASARAATSPPTTSAPTASAPEADEEVPVNRIRKVAAKRLTESQAVPHFFLTSIVDVEKLLEFRTEINESLEPQGIKVSVNDLFVRAAAVTLRQHPEANSSWGDDSLIRRANVNIGIAVATDAGLLVPVVRNADRKRLGTIAQETVALAGKARDGKLGPDEMSGGTFSISNLGMFGIDQFTAVINPPEAGILAVGAASPVPMLRDGVLVEVPKLKITLTVDHRVMDGAVAAGFLRDLVGALEHPVRILL